MMATVLQAGAVAVRHGATTPEVLLVTAKKDPRLWIFPKGHIDAGELPEDAALRELHEEAGVQGRLIGRLGSTRFQSGAEDVSVAYYLVDALNDGESKEGRRLRWLPLKLAQAELSFEDTRKLLDTAAEMLRAR